jgi:7-keto-8-aminopelargonate synthetase-like enzyme
MIYDHFFSAALDRLHQERRYRVFADLERIAGRFPHATWHSPDGPHPVVIWCSNDYLGMGQYSTIIMTMRYALVASSTMRAAIDQVIACWRDMPIWTLSPFCSLS